MTRFKISLIFILSYAILCCKTIHKDTGALPKLRVSKANPHLLETEAGEPVFINNFTLWKLIEHGTREDIGEILTLCREKNYNMVSSMILGIAAWEGQDYPAGTTAYGDDAFERDSTGFPDPLRPVTTPGNDPAIPSEYDFWDHVEYVIDLAASKKMYITLHPAWGNWFSGFVHGQKPEDVLLFDDHKAYRYGHWLGTRFGAKSNVVWMLGGDRSAIYDHKTRWYTDSLTRDYRSLYHAMAEGLADGAKGVDHHDGIADYDVLVMSYHPRKWGPNSSEWFHDAPWLDFNSIQDTPADQAAYIRQDYALTPVKPTWLYEPVYEGAIHEWGVRYQAYQTVLMGGFGHTYGSDIWEFKSNWRELEALPGNRQMKFMNHVVREIWTDAQFLNRMPDQTMILEEQGSIKGRGITAVTDFETKKNSRNESSDLITGMRCKQGEWALVYSAGGKDITLDLGKLAEGEMSAYWFNPRNGTWWTDDSEGESMKPFLKKVSTGKGSYSFNPPGEAGPDHDWILVLR